MSKQVGRISGPLLTANLERNGIDLAFRNDLDTTQLLYFDVNNNRIGVNNGVPTNELHTSGTTRTTDLIADSSNITNFRITDSTINSTYGDFNLNAVEAIQLPNLETSQFYLSDNYISTNSSNTNIEFNTNGVGRLIVGADDSTGDRSLNVRGNLHATGDITFDGSIIFGDDSTVDTVSIDSEINSDIVPNRDSEFSLGNAAQRWGYLSSELLNGQQITADVLSVGGINLEKRVGNIFYVSVNGSDSSSGDHVQDPFKTIKHALSQVDPSTDGPVEIRVFPGDYQEELPLEVPSNVTVRGMDLRTTVIRPDTANQSEDVFLMNGESSVAEITIKDFFYDSINDKGYAFRFAPNATITSRSPYIQNITVITQGSTITADDPRGFASGDAGKGALVDGADVLSTSNDASMLFHSVTFITPGVDALTMTNGVKVEWLNSFSYFANRGLYAFNGTTGHLSTDGSTTLYGAELRSIGSANVYGNYGAVADGDECLMYLIMHNFGYVGSGKLFDNDNFNAIQANEVVELNNGSIRYQSTNHLGNFRVGDNFLVDFQTGNTTLNIESLDAATLSGIVIDTGINRTTITGSSIDVGNFIIQGNDIDTTVNELIFDSANNIFNFNSNVNLNKDLDITGNLSFDGSLNLLGNNPADIINFNVDFDQTLELARTEVHSLGSMSNRWFSANLNDLQTGDIQIRENFISTDVSNSDLELRTNGTGIINIGNNNVVAEQDLTVGGATDLQNTAITGTLTQTGDKTHNGNYEVTNLSVENLDISLQTQLEDILFDGNVITTTTSDADLELRANGAGNVIFDESIVIPQNATIGTVISNTVNVVNQVNLNEVDIDNTIEFNDNYIETTTSNANLELRSEGGVISIQDSALFDQDLTIVESTTLKDTNIDGNVTQTGNTVRTGNTIVVGNISVSKIDLDRGINYEDIKIDGNTITTTRSNSDLELRANGSGLVRFENVQVDQDFNVGNIDVEKINVSNTVDLDTIELSTDIQLTENVITTTNSNSNLELRANGSGDILIENTLGINQNRIYTRENDLTIKVSSTDGIATITSTNSIVLPRGTTAERIETEAGLRFNTDTNLFEIQGSIANINMGGVYSSDTLTSISVTNSDDIQVFVNGSTEDSTTKVAEFNGYSSNLHALQIGPTLINNNQIGTNVSNSDLDIITNGTGSIKVGDFTIKGNSLTLPVDTNFEFKTSGNKFRWVEFEGSKAIKWPAGNTSERPLNPKLGTTRVNTDTNELETWIGTEWRTSAGEFASISEEQMEEEAFVQTLIYG